MDRVIQKYQDETIKDRYGKKYLLNIALVDGSVDMSGINDIFVKAKVYNSNKKHIGDFIGSTKQEVMQIARKNINILVYDMK